ncbi:polysaccharide pyruvyl transferase family protein [Larkinella terrae]|uniref:Polysaccharide pyruvyl transferase domain-containing protein n=1 Tax=Larkinella terrae TaxID=2025311 RepID=A0A7K0EEU0_9BACT|nr:polysaccharide pyruvyl transferase family protein [Larkinella terrae]MRS60265.1 hypothetical protein [Larkinella terrae]
MTSRRHFIKLSGLSMAATALPLRRSRPDAKPIILLKSSWNDKNIGDIGHTPGTLRLLERYVPEAQILLWHAAPRPVTEALVAKNFPKVRLISGGFEPDKPDSPVTRAFNEASLYIHNSGMSMNYGLFNFEWGNTMSHLAPMLYCRERNIPFGLYGQSFDKFASPADLIYRDVLNQAAFIYTRDKESLKYLNENKFKPAVLEFGPDGCFGIDVRDEEKGVAYLKQNGLEAGKFLTVVIRTNTPPLDGAGKGNLLNPAEPTPEQKAENLDWMAKMNQLISNWVRKTGLKVLIAPESLKETKYGRTLLYDTLPDEVKAKVVFREQFWSADEAMSVFARAHTLVGMEPHSLIMALALGVPVIHARALWHGRKGWMFRDIGLNDWLFDINKTSAETMNATLMQIHQDYPQAKEKARKAMLVVAERQKASMQVVRKLVKLAS